MKSVTLYKVGMEITDVSIQPNGEVVVNSGSVAGDYLLHIQPQDKATLCEALSQHVNIAPSMLGEDLDAQIIMLFNLAFSPLAEEPYQHIRDFLDNKGVPYKSDYWVNSR